MHGQKDIAKISNHDEDRITSMMDGRDDMAVEYRRLGIARILLDKVVKEARDYGCGTVQITASDMACCCIPIMDSAKTVISCTIHFEDAGEKRVEA